MVINLINIWQDQWMDLSPIECPTTIIHRSSSVSSFILHGKWHIPSWFKHQFPVHSRLITNITLPINESATDSLIWPDSTNGMLTFKDAYFFFSPIHKVGWSNQLWHSFIPPRIFATVWKIILKKCSTHDNLIKRGFVIVSRCEFCKNCAEYADHLFIHCHFASLLWDWIWNAFNIHFSKPNTIQNLWHFICNVKFSSQIKNLFTACCLICLYSIWEARNNWIFHNTRLVPSRTLHYIKGWLRDLLFDAWSHE